MAPVRLLLVNPRYPESFWSFRWAVERLARHHGDRVSVFVAERWRGALPIDSSVFDVVLEPE